MIFGVDFGRLLRPPLSVRMNSGLGASRVGWSLRDPETDVRWVVCSDGLAWPDLFDPLTFALLRAALRFPPGFA